MIWTITYKPNPAHRTNHFVSDETIRWVTPSSWNQKQVTENFSTRFPNSRILSISQNEPAQAL